MARLLDGFYRWLLYLGAVFMLATLVTILLGIAGRQFGFDIPGLDAYAGYSVAASLFLALPATLRNGEHIRVTLVLNRLHGNARRVLDYWCLLVGTAIAGYFAWYAVRLVWLSHITHDVSPAADMTPLWIPQLSMALGCIGLAVAFLEDLYLKIVSRERTVVAPAEMARVD
jgi:TRAP-type C4-dicarboxylate transport system permease small subunit